MPFNTVSEATVYQVDRILAVDDEPDNLFLVQTLLQNNGYEVVLAENGKAALEQVATAPPDLILLDVMMPGMDGYEVTRRLRQSADLPFIPILLITAHPRSSAIEGLDAGADDFIRKPLEVGELLARVRALLRLKHSTDAQAQLLRQREDFVSRLTHDLRTPLVAFDRMLELILEQAFGQISPDLETALVSMVSSNQNLLQMVNTLLEVYRHEAGRKTLTYCPCDLPELIEQVLQELSPLARDRGIELIVKDRRRPDAADPAASLIADRQELRRVLTNLIGNAIKFTEAGSVTVRLLRPDDAASPELPKFLTIEIEDTGIGIAAAEQATLFEQFRQGCHPRSGSGLGLYLSQRIIQAHQGTIEVESELNRGSLFRIRLPLAPSVSIEQGAQMTLV